MKLLESWIASGKIAQFVAGSLDADTHAEIFEAAKIHPPVCEAIIAAKDRLMEQLLTQMKQEDPEALIASGKLLAYSQDSLSEQERQYVELMAMAHPQVSQAMSDLKRSLVESLLQKVQAMDPQALIASSLLMDYVLGECSDAERNEVEMAASYFPAVASELSSLRELNERLILSGAMMPPRKTLPRFLSFLENAEMPADGWGLIMPPLSAASKPADYAAWVSRVNPEAINPEANLNAFPLDADPSMLTLFVVIKDGLEEETHLFDIERFLVLEGSCYIAMGNEKTFLKQGDYCSIPKFTAHTVVVTSEIPCKLIVQQVAA